MSYEGGEKNPISVGPWGGDGGALWDDGIYTTVRQLVVAHALAIDSIQIEYDKKGIAVWSEKHGGQGGSKIDKVLLDYPDEFLVSISGHYSSMVTGSPLIVRSLTFESNKRRYGPFGFQQGPHFSFPVAGGKIVGFHGRAGRYLDSIGVYLKPLKKVNPQDMSLMSFQRLGLNGSSSDDKGGYKVVQGRVGKGYDIVVAVREKEESNRYILNSYTREYSDNQESSNEGEYKNKLEAFPSYIEGGNSKNKGPVKFGPWGGNGGVLFDDGVYTGIRQINLTRNPGITSIKVLYDRNGQPVWGSKHGGGGGIRTDKIVFDYPYEVLTHISGHYGATFMMGPTAVKSLTFHTTRRKYGPFGDEQGMLFSSRKGEGMVVGLHGKKGWYIDSLGVHILEGNLVLPQPPQDHNTHHQTQVPHHLDTNLPWSNKLSPAKPPQKEEIVMGVVKEPVPSGPGPWGGEGGRPWDDGVFSGVKQIFLTREEAITSIQIEYDRNGQSVWSTKHGGGAGDATHRIKFEYPNETLNCICGYYGTTDGRDEKHRVIRSLTFYTSRGKYGPFGEERGVFFTSTTTVGKVVGFHGRSSLYLDAIGVHMQHWLGERKPTRSMITKFFS